MLNNRQIPREHYLEKLRQSRDTPFIKVITGIRRCGKSTLLDMYTQELIESGVPSENIFHMNFDMDYPDVPLDHRALTDLVTSKITLSKGNYVFLDEVQNVAEWERTVISLYNSNVDVYVTGSNSDMLSSELSTKLSGRCLEIMVQPLMFSEYVNFRKIPEKEILLEDYIRFGGFPTVALVRDVMPAQTTDILDGIYNTVFNKDVAGRYEIRNSSSISNLSKYMMKNIGDRVSVRGVSNYLTSKGIKVDSRTVNQYIGFLESALLFRRAKRLDSKTKEYLRTADKFYAADLGIRHSQLPFHVNDLDGILENVVYNELVYRYGDVAIYNVDSYEIDFIVDPMGTPSYYQVSLSVADSTTLEREMRPLKLIQDNYPKTIITYDRFLMKDVDGIRVVSLLDWLMEEN